MLKFIKISATALTLAVGVSAASASDDGDWPYDVNKPGWHNANIVQTFAQIPVPGGNVVPTDERPDNTAYLVGNIFPVSPFGAEQVIDQLPPDFPLPFVTVPAHDDVFAKHVDEPHDTFGFWVVPGANAITDGEDQNVKVRPMPDFSLAGAPLAYAVKAPNGNWRLLTSAKLIERAVEHGLLEAVPSGPDNGFGGIGWLAPGRKK